ncbi:GerAB/ArcD/ProY family transporter [Clostridium sediminicola]|uniref:GerAB/ArcD/ProY family transporter n=1 Tax=Clostridium sediminicola TaxID=3114879 RepID=UPI0031F227F6
MNKSLTNRQIAFIIFGIVSGYGILSLPKTIAESSGTGGWFTLLIATIIVMIFTYIITYLGYVHEDKTIYEYNQIIVGKGIASIFIIIYCLYFFMLFTMGTRMACEAIKQTVLIKTPIWALIMLFYLVMYYAVAKRLCTIAKVCEIYGAIIIISAIVIHLAMTTQGKVINLKPFFVIEDIKEYFKATSVTIFPFLGIEILTIVPFNKKNNDKNIFKYTISMVGFIGIFYIFVFESCISVMEIDSIIYYQDALFATIRRIDIESLEFLERLDGIFLIIWIMSIFCTLTLEAYGSILLLSKFLKKINFNLISALVFAMSFFIALVPKTIDTAQKILDYVGYTSIITAGLIPLILYIITKVKKIDKKTI